MANKKELETVPPLTRKRYAETLADFHSRIDEHDILAREVMKNFISDNGLDKKPVRMMSIGPGVGVMEKSLVEKSGLQLEYIYAIEPNSSHTEMLKSALESLGVKYDIDTSFFDKDFRFGEKFGSPKFDFIFLSHVLYGFDDPYGAIPRLIEFLKPGGKIFIILIQEKDLVVELFKYLVENSDPSIFSADLALQDNAFTAEKVTRYLRLKCPKLAVSTLEYRALVNMDKFVRGYKKGELGNDETITFFLQAEFKNLSVTAKKDIHEIVWKHCEIVDDRYLVKSYCACVVVSP